MRTLPEIEQGPLETHVFFCLLCQDRLTETEAFVTAMRAAAAECLRLGEPISTPAHSFTHDTDDGLIMSEVIRQGPEKWHARHWGPQLDGGRTTTTLREAIAYLTESFQQIFPDHVVCTTRCRWHHKRPNGRIVKDTADC